MKITYYLIFNGQAEEAANFYEEPEALQFFNSLSENEQHNYVKWIYSAKTDQTKVDRIAKTLIRLTKKQRIFH